VTDSEYIETAPEGHSAALEKTKHVMKSGLWLRRQRN